MVAWPAEAPDIEPYHYKQTDTVGVGISAWRGTESRREGRENLLN